MLRLSLLYSDIWGCHLAGFLELRVTGEVPVNREEDLKNLLRVVCVQRKMENIVIKINGDI